MSLKDWEKRILSAEGAEERVRIHEEMYANDLEYRAAYDATVEHNKRWMAGEELHDEERGDTDG